MLDLTIIIVAYNPGAILYDCLRSLTSGVGDLSYEVIVVDNASKDGIIQQAAEQFPGTRFIINTDNRGFAGGNNQGLAQAKGLFLLLLNPDVVVEPGSLAVTVHFLEQHPEIGVVGPRTLNGSGEISLTAHSPYNTFSILWQYIGLDRLFPHHVYGHYRSISQSASEPFEVAWVQACCLMTRREVVEQIGGLDTGFFLFSEDPDFCDRALQAGWKICFLPSAQVTHYESSTVSRYPERRIRHYHISPLYYFRKRQHEDQVWLLKVGFTFEMMLKIGVRLAQKLRKNKGNVSPAVYWNILKDVWRY